MKTIFSLILILIGCRCWASLNQLIPPLLQTQIDTSKNEIILQGTVTDQKSNEPIIFGSVAIYQNGVLVTGGETDFDGVYTIRIPKKALQDEMKIDVEVSYLGYRNHKIEGVILKERASNRLDIQLSEENNPIEFIFPYYHSPIVSPDDFTKGQILDANQIRQRGN